MDMDDNDPTFPVREAVLERSANDSANPNAPRNRKAAKPAWNIVLNILANYLMLILVLVFLFELVRMIAVNSDMKVDSLVGDLKKDIGKKIEQKSLDFETQLQKLETALDDLKSKNLLTMDDLGKLSDELVKKRGSRDEIRELAREIVDKELAKHAADGLGMVDYALGNVGGRVMKHSEPLILKKRPTIGTNSQEVHKDAKKMLRPSFGEPGECFPLRGSSGFVQIRLRIAIVPEAITLEHVSKSVAYNRSTAPQNCLVTGWLQRWDGLETELNTDSENGHLLTEFTYDLEKSNVQTFKVSESMRSVAINVVKFEFTSNHGNPNTCIYRLRVHGYESSDS